MHCIQYIATMADDVDEAHSKVKHYLEIQLGDDPYTAPSASWYDWFVTGGGRWASNEDPYDDSFTGDVAHQSDTRFQTYLDTVHKYRKESLSEYLEGAKKINLTELLDSLGDSELDNFRAGMELYPIHQIYETSIGVWNHNSYFFDIEHDSHNTVHMRETIDNGADNWYLVPVDFHF